MYESFALSVIGQRNKTYNIARRDAAIGFTAPGGEWSMAAVSDGYGGKDSFRSHIGSMLAVNSAAKTIKSYMRSKETLLQSLRGGPISADEALMGLRAGILENWRGYVEQFDKAVAECIKLGKDGREQVSFDFGELSIQSGMPEGAPPQTGISLAWEREWEQNQADIPVKFSSHTARPYGCTLIVSVMAPEFAICLQIGNGWCINIHPIGTAWPVFMDEDSDGHAEGDGFRGSSLCDNDAIESFRAAYMLAPEWKEIICGEQDDETETPDEDDMPDEEADSFEQETDDLGGGEDDGLYDEDDEEYEDENDDDDGDDFYDDEEEDDDEIECIVMGSQGPLPPAGFVMSTDGLIDSFKNDEGFLKFNRRVLGRMGPAVRKIIGVELEAHLSKRSARMGGDDISIAVAFDEGIDFDLIMP